MSVISGITVIASATTAFDGSYDIPDVKPGSYTIGFSAPAPLLLLPGGPISIGGQNSYVFADTGSATLTETLTVHSGDFDTVSAALYPTSLANPSDGTGAVTGVVWLDGSGDGVMDAGDAGLAGVSVTLWDYSAGTSVGPATTNADGSYLFTEVPQGTYTAVVTLPSGYTMETTGSGLYVDVSQFSATAENIAAYQAGSISGTVTDDISGNGIGGVEVSLINQTTGNTVGPIATAPDGSYSFGNLHQGSYSVHFVAVGGTTLDGTGGNQSWTSPVQNISSGSSLEVDAPGVCDLQLQTPQNVTVKVGQPVTLNSSATSYSNIANVQWQISYQDEDPPVTLSLTGLTPTYTFEHYGTYTLTETVTNAGTKRSAARSTSSRDELVPAAVVTAPDTVNEGSKETFDVLIVDADQPDTPIMGDLLANQISIFVDWTDTGNFDELDLSTALSIR